MMNILSSTRLLKFQGETVRKEMFVFKQTQSNNNYVYLQTKHRSKSWVTGQRKCNCMENLTVGFHDIQCCGIVKQLAYTRQTNTSIKIFPWRHNSRVWRRKSDPDVRVAVMTSRKETLSHVQLPDSDRRVSSAAQMDVIHEACVGLLSCCRRLAHRRSKRLEPETKVAFTKSPIYHTFHSLSNPQNLVRTLPTIASEAWTAEPCIFLLVKHLLAFVDSPSKSIYSVAVI